nr:uncharacterized protein CFP56_27744 [Quercus suber]
MEDEADLDDEVENLREGLVAVKFSGDFKKRTRTPWSKALIVKVYGRSVGLNFLHNRLLSLWKLAGRLDCVDLEHGFYLTRFSLKDDYEAILKKGPWFIGENFLSIRPWEPDFRPASANVTSIAVWIRLKELPIEYYNPEVLIHIGKSIGNVLRVDSHTAMETRGRYARICVQVDVDKPLPTAVLIGKCEQTICYEGLQSLCFSCGRIGHRKENCPYTIRAESSSSTPGKKENGTSDSQPCDERVPDNVGPEVEPSKIMHEGVREEGSGGAYNGLDNGRLKHKLRRNVNEARFNNIVGKFKASDGPAREFKRKLLSSKPATEAHLADVELKASSSVSHQAYVALGRSPNFHDGIKGKDGPLSKVDHKVSVKSKKALARAKAYIINPQTKTSSCQALSHSIQSVSCSPQENQQQGDSTSKPDLGRESLPSTKPWLEVGFKFKGSCGGEECEGGSSKIRGSSNLDGGTDGNKLCSEAFGESARELVGIGSTDCDVVLRGGAEHGVAETECIELKEEGHAFISC